MKYLMIHALDEDATPRTGSNGEPLELAAWIEEMEARGVVLDGARLHPVSDATSVRAPNGTVVVTDGPFAETKEQVAGYDVIDCPDLDSAIAVAAAHPTTGAGSIELRPFDEGMPDPEVPESVPDGKRRYLMLVCADMRRAMAAELDATEVHADSVPERSSADDEEEDEPIDRWIADAGARRLYGWPLAFPDTAVTVRRVDGEVVTTDGPFAETKEQIAGYDLLECTDLDDALEVASSHPVAATGVIELRPLRL
ncbi:MAG TPA: YciI family protein [Nocardioides sp.]|jgi:hypothetical protein|nr:YciI family protein [Nocardioides sp.]